MIILKINVNGVLALPPKCGAPIASNRNGVLSTPVAFERVKSKARKIYISRRRRRVECIQDHTDLRNKLRWKAACVASFPESLQSPAGKIRLNQAILVFSD
jgi:hypothetical protein